MQRCKEINIYKRLSIKQVKREALTDEEKEEKAKIEDKWNYHELKEVIYAAIDQEFRPPTLPNETNATNNKEGWGSWMMRGGELIN